MPVVRLGDFAENVIAKVAQKYSIEKKNIKIKNIGLRPGEKLFEELMSEDEALRALELHEWKATTPTEEKVLALVKKSEHKRLPAPNLLATLQRYLDFLPGN